jgi:hypothetical protein
MSIMPISPISSTGEDYSNPQNSMRQNLNNLQSALSSGNLAAAQQAMASFSQGLQADPSANGVRASASDNPQATLRTDRAALQSTLDSGDVTAAQQSLIRIIQDTQEIASAQRAQQAQPGNQAVSALPNLESGDEQNDAAPATGEGSETAKLIDVMA